MRTRCIIIDANLLVLLVVGRTARCHISQHKRLDRYDEAAFQLLIELLARAEKITVTPNILTEASNLLAYGPDSLRTRVLVSLAAFVKQCETETYVPSSRAVERPEFPRLGLTDSAILEACDENTTLLTDDKPLYLAALHGGTSAHYFSDIRRAAGPA